MFITKDNFIKFLSLLKKDYNAFVPVKNKKQRYYKRYDGLSEDMVISEVRPYEPLKAFFTRAKEKVAEGFKPNVSKSSDKPFAIVGVKNCDLQGFKVQDYVFCDNDYKDPFYIKAREDNLIIATDCTCAIDTCFCLSLGNQPYPESNFDIGLCEVENGYLAEVKTDKGKDLLNKNSLLFQNADKNLISQRDSIRKRVIKEVEENIKKNNIPHHSIFKGIIEKNYESEIWKEESKTCVECGACTIICPSCHCFLLSDQKSDDAMIRLRTWDSCMLKGYARVAGGANPRPVLWMRLRNRFEKKFDFFPKVAAIFGCTGCGRCISACPAKIDIRKVLKKLTENA